MIPASSIPYMSCKWKGDDYFEKKSTILNSILLSMIMVLAAAWSPQSAKADNLSDYTVNLYSHKYDTRGSNYSNCPYGGLHTHSDSCKKDKLVTRTTTA